MYSQKIDEFVASIKTLNGKLTLCTKSDNVYPDVISLTEIMEKSIENSSNEIFSACVYNAVATIKSAPKGCSVAQLVNALEDASEEMKLMKEYL